MFDPTIDAPFSAGVTRLDTIWAPSKPIWITAEENGIATVVSGWPGEGLVYLLVVLCSSLHPPKLPDWIYNALGFKSFFENGF